jgi:hypothetical protein
MTAEQKEEEIKIAIQESYKNLGAVHLYVKQRPNFQKTDFKNKRLIVIFCLMKDNKTHKIKKKILIL